MRALPQRAAQTRLVYEHPPASDGLASMRAPPEGQRNDVIVWEGSTYIVLLR